MKISVTSARFARACARLFLVVFFAATVFAVTSAAADKLTPEELIAKHLESIGTSEARAKIKSRIMIGGVLATFRGQANGTLDGRAVLASENLNNMILMRFGSPDYPHEKVGFDGKQFTVGFTRPGIRTELGSFLERNNVVFKQGVMGGVLSSAWTLANLSTAEVKLDYAGMGKINDRPVHKLRFRPRKSADLEVMLYFDAENFRHLRTQYEQDTVPRLGATDQDSAQQREARWKLVEDYSDFKQENGLTLPHSYLLQYSQFGNNKSFTYSWKINLEQFTFNKPIAANSFNVAS